MDWLVISLTSMVVGVIAHHLGLTDEAGKIARKIASCPKCCSFWLSLSVLLYKGCDLFISIALSLLVAYLSYYFGLLLILLQKIYDYLWQKVNRDQ